MKPQASNIGGEAQVQERDDLFYGQVVIIAARWFLITGATTMTLWTAANVNTMLLPLLGIVVLIAVNCYLHARYLLRRPANTALTALSAVVDIAVVSAIIAAWTAGSGNGAASEFFVFYYPTLLAVALVFPPRLSLPLAAITLAVYAALVLGISGPGTLTMHKALAERLLTMGAAAGLGAYFWRTQRDRALTRRRHTALLLDEIEFGTANPTATMG